MRGKAETSAAPETSTAKDALRLLALKFDRAVSLYALVEKLARRVGGAFRPLCKSKRGIVIAAVAALVF